MFYTFFKHSIKSSLRNIRFDVNFVITIITTLSIVYVYALIFYLGFNFEKLLRIYKPQLDPIIGFNSMLLYLFLIGMFLLLIFQKKCSIDIIPYMHLPIKRGKIISYVLVLKIFNFFNLAFILFVIPFSVKCILPSLGMKYFIPYLTGVLLILAFVSYLVLLLRNLVNVKTILVLVPIGILFLGFLAKGVFHVSIETVSMIVFRNLMQGNVFVIMIMLFSLIGLLTANFSLLKNTIYTINSGELISVRASDRSKIAILKSNLPWYVSLEINLISRNKRLRVFFISSIGFLFLFYYLLQNNQNSLYFSFIIFILINGIFGYIFSQYLFSWESSYFDFIFSSKFDLIKYLKAKYIIYVILGFFVFLLFLPLIIQKKIDLHLFITALLYNSCIGYFILFYMATFNRSRIELNGNIFFNLQGYNGTQVIAIFIILVFPWLILLFLSSVMNFTTSLILINSLSLFSLLFQRKWFKIILRQLSKRKYINLEGYRK